MKSFSRMLSKEYKEIVRTWRLPTVGGVLLFFAAMSPLAALATPALVASVTAGQPGLVIQVPDPTYLDSYVQWIKNLSQMGLFLVVFTSAGLVAGERQSGTAVLVVTKPVSRTAFVVAKFVAQAVLVSLSTAVGTAIVYAGTLLAFGEAPAAPLFGASAVWLAGALLAVASTLALSAALPTLAAGVLALVASGLLGIAALWEPAVRLTPAGLLSAPSAILAGDPVALIGPVVSSIVCVGALVLIAGGLFSRKEL